MFIIHPDQANHTTLCLTAAMTAPCCPSGSHGPLPPDEVALLRGWPERQADLECYFSGQKENPTMIILAFSDVFGPMSGKHRRICDEMATAIPGSLVCLPDLFDGEPICPDFLDSKFPGLRLKLFFPKMLYRIRYRYGWAKLGPKIQALVDSFSSSIPMSTFGFCFGGYLAVKASSTGSFRGAVGFHPSLIVGRLQCSPHSEKDTPFTFFDLNDFGFECPQEFSRICFSHLVEATMSGFWNVQRPIR